MKLILEVAVARRPCLQAKPRRLTRPARFPHTAKNLRNLLNRFQILTTRSSKWSTGKTRDTALMSDTTIKDQGRGKPWKIFLRVLIIVVLATAVGRSLNLIAKTMDTGARP